MSVSQRRQAVLIGLVAVAAFAFVGSWWRQHEQAAAAEQQRRVAFERMQRDGDVEIEKVKLSTSYLRSHGRMPDVLESEALRREAERNVDAERARRAARG